MSTMGPETNRRFHELDALRGLAALTVVAHHLRLTISLVERPASAVWWEKLLLFGPLQIFWAGHEAVVFFFVLSGFVLSLPYFSQKRPLPYHLYLSKRILRAF